MKKNYLIVKLKNIKNNFHQLVKDEQGLSLVELLAVVVILAVISGIGILGIGKIIQNTREDAALADLQQAFNAAEIYRKVNNIEPGMTFNILDVKKAGLFKQTNNWWYRPQYSNVSFKEGEDGILRVSMWEGAVIAGRKFSTLRIYRATKADFATIDRKQMFYSKDPTIIDFGK